MSTHPTTLAPPSSTWRQGFHADCWQILREASVPGVHVVYCVTPDASGLVVFCSTCGDEWSVFGPGAAAFADGLPAGFGIASAVSRADVV